MVVVVSIRDFGTLPHTVTHLQFVDAEDVPRFANYRVIAAPQLLWAVADPSTNEEVKPYIDPAIHARMYPAGRFWNPGPPSPERATGP